MSLRSPAMCELKRCTCVCSSPCFLTSWQPSLAYLSNLVQPSARLSLGSCLNGCSRYLGYASHAGTQLPCAELRRQEASSTVAARPEQLVSLATRCSLLHFSLLINKGSPSRNRELFLILQWNVELSLTTYASRLLLFSLTKTPHTLFVVLSHVYLE